MARARPLLPIVLILALVPFADAAAKDYIVGYQGSVSSPERATDRRERSQGFDATHRYDAALEGFAADLDASAVGVIAHRQRMRTRPRRVDHAHILSLIHI